MNDKPNCDSCRFWEAHGLVSDVGECHRHAPHPMHRKELHYEVAFPLTSFLHWCGEHQAELNPAP